MPDTFNHVADKDLEELRDERSLRLAAEGRAADLATRAQLWRERAEERATRIKQLEHDRDLPAIRRFTRAIRSGWRQGITGGSPSGSGENDAEGPLDHVQESVPLWREYPSTRLVALTSSRQPELLSSQFLTLPPSEEWAWHEADLAVVEDAAWQDADDTHRSMIEQWMDLPGRCPIAWVSSTDTEGAGSPPFGDVVIGFDSIPTEGHPFAPVLDPAADAPWRNEGAVTTVDAVDWNQPTREDLVLAGAGRLALAGADPDHARAIALRLAYRRHAPWIRARELLDLAGVDAASRPSTVGALLVSRRPDEVTDAFRNLLRARHVDLEVVVGLHGVPAPAELRDLIDSYDVPVTVLELEPQLTLGACLNRAADACSAPFLAKIDDDDHYGPGHLEDALHALRYTGAGVVGKAEQFTYVESEDRTVLRRAGTRHTFVSGTPSGASWVFRRSAWEQAPFPHRARRVDQLCLAAMRRSGATVYVTGPWEFCVTRRATDHTWITTDDTFLAGALPKWAGQHNDRVELDESLLL